MKDYASNCPTSNKICTLIFTLYIHWDIRKMLSGCGRLFECLCFQNTCTEEHIGTYCTYYLYYWTGTDYIKQYYCIIFLELILHILVIHDIILFIPPSDVSLCLISVINTTYINCQCRLLIEC